MAKRLPPTKRVRRPFEPIADVLVVSGSKIQSLSYDAVSSERVGLKAFGLACLPVAWTKSFFVARGDSDPVQSTLEKTLGQIGIPGNADLLVRSSGATESIEHRGKLESVRCSRSQLALEINRLKGVVLSKGEDAQQVHWVVQEFVDTVAKGHLSNERRVSEHKRDWVAEIEASSSHLSEYHRIALRPWRDSRSTPEEALTCPYRETYIDRLKDVARWTYDRLLRVHFEWVWDGTTVYIVQADTCEDISDGVDPADLVRVPSLQLSELTLQKFRTASADDFNNYRKLSNARLYQELGYTAVPFYVLDSQDELQLIVKDGRCSPELLCDLDALTRRPLVIRTDGQNIPDERRTMLPRSDELRTAAAAAHWLLHDFRDAVLNAGGAYDHPLSNFRLCLVGHHFVPAAASAWCQARPDNRRVRIESLWGIPEGLYWYAYDAYDVDTQTFKADGPQPTKMLVRERRRFKEHFVAPDALGAWVVHRTAAGPDWQGSIKMKKWIEEIAWTSRRIATRLGQPVVVMWFIDLPGAVSKHEVIPWYHDVWKPGASLQKAAPRKKIPTTSDVILRTGEEWNQLKRRIQEGNQPISRVIVDPREPELLRDQKFAEELGLLAKEHQFVIELGGGILSHAYYMLSSSGCAVECADLDDYATSDEELEFNKLVRDRIPESIVARGESVVLMRLEGEALISALRRKLVEESLEVLDAKNSDQIVEELADVKEVMLAITSRLDISDQKVEAARKRKGKSRGVFDSALMLARTAVAPSMSMHEMGSDDPMGNIPQQVSTTISRAIEIPSHREDIHLDKRFSVEGAMERQFTAVLPAHASGFHPARTTFDLATPAGQQHEMMLEIQLERVGADLRLRLRLINRPKQLVLDLDPPSGS
jgi:predicted house-cleaning noncanonical NTP pyrophosphatase (MazG superfamily)